MSVAAEKATATADITYEDLYRRWEQGNWSAYEIDFSEDRAGWRGPQRDPGQVRPLDLLDVLLRRGLGHRQPLPLHRRRPAGGAEVLPRHPAGRRGQARRLLPPLLQGGDRGRRQHLLDPRLHRSRSSTGAIAASSTASTGWRRSCARTARCRSSPRRSPSTTWWSRRPWPSPGSTSSRTSSSSEGTMPGFSSGMANVSRDEQRHIGFGVKALSEMFAESEECKAAVVELLREVMPYSVAVFIPPDWDERYTTSYGFTLEDIYVFGTRSIEAKWRAAGYPLEEMPSDIYPVDRSLPHEERARTQIKLLKAGILGEPERASGLRSRGAAALLRVDEPLGQLGGDQRRRSGGPVAVQRRRPLAPGDRQRLDPGGARGGGRPRPHPRDQLAGVDRDLDARPQPRALVLGRRLRPQGSPSALRRFRRVFGG